MTLFSKRQHRLWARAWLLALALSTVAYGCAAPLCSGPKPLAAGPKTKVKAAAALETSDWLMLLLRGPSHTCTGAPILASEKPSGASGCGGAVRLEPSHLLVQNVGAPKQHVVWLKTHLCGGSPTGPLALVRETKRALEVRALGTLTLPPGAGPRALLP